MSKYKELLRDIIGNGLSVKDRTGVGTRSVIGRVTHYSLAGGRIPIVTEKLTKWELAFKEMIGLFIPGKSNTKSVGSKIWDAWAKPNGDLGPIYGVQWRHWRHHEVAPLGSERAKILESRGYHSMGRLERSNSGVFYKEIDQLQEAIEKIRKNPFTRQAIVSAWNPGDIADMALPPCHTLFQLLVREIDGKKKLFVVLFQRSSDVFLGLPFNVSQYALLAHMIGEVLGYEAHELIHMTSDTHLYSNQIEPSLEVLTRESYPDAKIKLRHRDNIDDFTFEDITIEGYQSGPHIKVPVAV